jgi:hypothetical protein
VKEAVIQSVTGSDYTGCERKRLYKIGKNATILDVKGSYYTECGGMRSCRSVCLEKVPVTATLVNGFPDLDNKPDLHEHEAGVLHNDMHNSVEVEKRKTEINGNNNKVMGYTELRQETLISKQ